MPEATVQLNHRALPVVDGSAVADGGLESVGARPLLHHVQLKTRQPEEMAAWYAAALSMVVSHRGSGAVWLTNDDANHRLAFLSTPKLEDDPDQIKHVGMHHTGWEFSTLDDLLATYVRLRDAGHLPHRTVNHGPITSFYYLDPDDNSVELQVDNYNDWRESVKFMASEAFAKDPFGPGVDPEALIAQRDAGVEPDELVRRSYAGEFPTTRPNDRRIPL